MAGTLVLGVGNVLLADEGAGVHAMHYLEDSQRSGIEGRQIDFPSWRLIGADYLVKGQIGREEGKIALELRFYEAAKSKQIEGRLYKLPEKDLSLAVHHFANVGE